MTSKATARRPKAEKPYDPMSARLSTDEIFMAAVSGWIVGAIVFVAADCFGAIYHWYEPYWRGDGAYFVVALTAAVGWIVIVCEFKIRRRQRCR